MYVRDTVHYSVKVQCTLRTKLKSEIFTTNPKTSASRDQSRLWSVVTSWTLVRLRPRNFDYCTTAAGAELPSCSLDSVAVMNHWAFNGFVDSELVIDY
jgi:hypothetical protein